MDYDASTSTGLPVHHAHEQRCYRTEPSSTIQGTHVTEDGRQHQQQLQQRRVMMYQHGTRYQTPDMSWGDKRYFKAYRRSYSRHGSNPKLGSAHYYCVLLLVPHGWYSVAALQRTSRPRPSTGEEGESGDAMLHAGCVRFDIR